MNDFSGYQRQYLLKHAHALNARIQIGKQGVFPGVINAVQEDFSKRELIKIKFIARKDERRELTDEIAKQTGAAVVRIIGNVAILYLPHEDTEKRRYHIPRH